jgi:hypothetical protein
MAKTEAAGTEKKAPGAGKPRKTVAGKKGVKEMRG